MTKAASWDRSVLKPHVPAPQGAGSILPRVPAPGGQLDLCQPCTCASPTSSGACPEPPASVPRGVWALFGDRLRRAHSGRSSVACAHGPHSHCKTAPRAAQRRAGRWLLILPCHPALLPGLTQARGNLLLPALPHLINSLPVCDVPQHSPSVSAGRVGHLQRFLFVSQLPSQPGAAPFSRQGKRSPKPRAPALPGVLEGLGTAR